MSDEIVARFMRRREAKALGLPRYFSGKPCKKGHLADRQTNSGGCCVCAYELCKKKQANVEARRAYEKRWREQNPEKMAEKGRRARAARGDKMRAANRAYFKARPEYNREKVSRYSAAKAKAAPPWLTQEHRREMYERHKEAAHLTKETGTPYEVDHIVPLRGRWVCGLHVPWNLQVLPSSVNRSKGNGYGEYRRSHRWEDPCDR